MPDHKCFKCGTSEQSGAYFRRCNDCGAEYCHEHSYEGKQCPECNRGYLKKA